MNGQSCRYCDTTCTYTFCSVRHDCEKRSAKEENERHATTTLLSAIVISSLSLAFLFVVVNYMMFNESAYSCSVCFGLLDCLLAKKNEPKPYKLISQRP